MDVTKFNIQKSGLHILTNCHVLDLLGYGQILSSFGTFRAKTAKRHRPSLKPSQFGPGGGSFSM